ncbi:MAG: hypothetical protein ACD_73C00600G0002 [uncultured bacterium]|nr:MAG: hypothetical protein ACD_73C00600G0002 [uncultured bacterium]
MKKTISLIFLFVLIWMSQALANDWANEQVSILKMVDEGRLDEALKAFDDLKESPTLWYNKGTLLTRMGRLGEGRYYLEKAHIALPRNEMINHNLNYLMGELSKNHAQLDFALSPLERSMVLARYLSWSELNLLSVVSWLLFWGCITIYFLTKMTSFKKWAQLLFFMSLFLFIPLIYKMIHEKGDTWGIIIKNDAKLYGTFVDTNNPSGSVSVGVKVKILDNQQLDQNNSRWQVLLPDNRRGWIDENDAELL